jgi:DNA replication protein DnaC
MEDLVIARGDGRYGKLMRSYAKTRLIVLDDWGLTPMTNSGCRELLEMIEDRHGKHSTIITSQLPVDTWHDYLNDPTLADAILDRIVHNAYKLTLKGESMRKLNSTIDDN